MGVRRRKTLKWIPNELLERVSALSRQKGFSENEVLRHALAVGLEILEKERDLLEEIEEIKKRLNRLEEGGITVHRREVVKDPFIEKLVEEV